MSRTITTVRDLWCEYTIGLGASPSVKTMYEGDTVQWRQNDSERRFYRRRKVILDAVVHMADKRGIPTDEAAAALDVWRLRQANTSLNNLTKSVHRFEMEELDGT